MEQSKKSKRVSWVPDEYLCEVKPVLETDCPSRIGTIPALYGPSPSLFTSSFVTYAKVYGNIGKKKTSKTLQSHDEINPAMPPGFEISHNLFGKLKWKCPPKFDMRHKWLFVAGTESEEANVQKLREMRELEVIYPRSKAIPNNPYISLDIENEHYDDRKTPIIPIIPLEEDEEAADESDLAKPVCISINSHPPTLPQVELESANAPVAEAPASYHPPTLPQVQLESTNAPVVEAPASEIPDVQLMACVAILTSLLKEKNPGASVDTDLLAKILRNPQMIDRFSDVTVDTVTAPMVAAKPVTEPVATSDMPGVVNLINGQAGPVENSAPSAAASSPMVGANSVTEPVFSLNEETSSLHMPAIAPMSAQVNFSIPNLVPLLNPVPVPIQPDSVGILLQSTFGAMPAQPGPFPMSSYAAMTTNPTQTEVAPNLVPSLSVQPDPASMLLLLAQLGPFPMSSYADMTTNPTPTMDALNLVPSLSIQPDPVSMLLQSAFGPLPAQPGPYTLASDAAMTTNPTPTNNAPSLVPSLSIQPDPVSMLLQSSFGSLPAQPGPFPISSYAAMTTSPAPTRDAHYFHNLIQEYGDDKQDMPNCSNSQPDSKHNPFQNRREVQKTKSSKTKYMKCCKYYFGSATGCLNGSKCLYRHDILPKLQAGEARRAKKRKLK